jgi:deazaflavin-dependent oxidoreductase (nitroreductase family)
MPLPRALARFNVRVTNRVLRHVVVWLPGFAVVAHVGRRTGIVHETPLMLFRHEDRFVIAMTYGPDTEWAKNVLAAGGCRARTRRHLIELTAPHLVHDPSRRMVPWVVRPVLRLLRADDFLVLSRA